MANLNTNPNPNPNTNPYIDKCIDEFKQIDEDLAKIIAETYEKEKITEFDLVSELGLNTQTELEEKTKPKPPKQDILDLSPKVDQNLVILYSKIRGKKVFIFDLETTGIFDTTQCYKYWDNSVFNTARIVEIGYYYSDNFGVEDDFYVNSTIHSYLRKPIDFDYMHEMAEEKHGLSIDFLKTNGFKFSQILNSGLINMLNNAEYIISHNTTFDFYILLNELNRFKLKNTI
jgi:DNA polymerase III epsilon subunit-like protein